MMNAQIAISISNLEGRECKSFSSHLEFILSHASRLKVGVCRRHTQAGRPAWCRAGREVMRGDSSGSSGNSGTNSSGNAAEAIAKAAETTPETTAKAGGNGDRNITRYEREG